MGYNRYASHTVFSLTAHFVWVTKYRYPVLRGEIQLRTRELIKQVCNAQDVKILKGVVSKDHIHIHVSYPASLSCSEFMRRIKGRSGRKLLMEFPDLKKRYWGGRMWGIGYGVWSAGNISDAMIDEYLEHHRQNPNQDDDSFILE